MPGVLESRQLQDWGVAWVGARAVSKDGLDLQQICDVLQTLFRVVSLTGGYEVSQRNDSDRHTCIDRHTITSSLRGTSMLTLHC